MVYVGGLEVVCKDGWIIAFKNILDGFGVTETCLICYKLVDHGAIAIGREEWGVYGRGLPQWLTRTPTHTHRAPLHSVPYNSHHMRAGMKRDKVPSMFPKLDTLTPRWPHNASNVVHQLILAVADYLILHPVFKYCQFLMTVICQDQTSWVLIASIY